MGSTATCSAGEAVSPKETFHAATPVSEASWLYGGFGQVKERVSG